MVVIYAANLLEQTSTHVLELTRDGVQQGDSANYKLLSSVRLHRFLKKFNS
jgi:hypothetical protein